MPPGDIVHHIREGAHHAVAAGGDILGLFVHQVIRIAAGGLGKLLLILAERIAIPAHDHARLESQRLILPDAGDAVAVDADAAMLVGLGLVGVVFILPEAAAEDGRLIRVHHADAHAAELRVAAARDDRRALGKAGFRGALRADLRDDRAALGNLREDARLEADGSGDLVVPVARLQIKNAGGAGVGRLGGEHARHFVDEPVVEHGAHRGLFIDLGHLVLDPEEAGERAQRVGLAGLAVDLLFKLRVHVHELRHFVVAARVHVGAGPDFLTILVVEDDALAHAGGGDGGDVVRIDAGLLDHAADAAAGEIPVVHPVKIHAAGVAGVFAVRPFLLDAAELLALEAEQHGADAAGARIDGHKRFCH